MKPIIYNSKPHYNYLKKSSEMMIKIVFPCYCEQKDGLGYLLINQLINNYNLKYPTEKKLQTACLKKMILSNSSSSLRVGDNLFIFFTLRIPNSPQIKDFNFREAIDFFKDYIYKPNVKNEAFNRKQFNREKEYLISQNNKTFTNINDLSYFNFLKYFDFDFYNVCVRNTFYKINDLTPSSLYTIYKNLVPNNHPLIDVIGNITKEEEQIINEVFKFPNEEYLIKPNYYHFLAPNNKVIDIEDNSNYSQSMLYLGFKVEKMTKKDLVYLFLLKDFLAHRVTNLLLNALRYENNLVYSASVNGDTNKGLMIISASILKDNKDLTISVINKLLKSFTNEDIVQKNLDLLIQSLKYEIIEEKDKPFVKQTRYLDHKLKISHSLNELYQSYCKIDIQSFIKFMMRVKLDTIYFYKGEK